MSSGATGQRRRSLIFPREHGTWGLLLVPLITGGAAGLLAGGSAAPLAPFTLAALALFWLRTPVESWIGTSPVRARTPGELRSVQIAAGLLTAAAAAAFAWLFRGGRNLALVGIGAGAAAAFVVQALVKGAWRQGRVAAQMIGAAGRALAAPAAYYVVTGGLNTAAWSLWIANCLFAGNQVHYVQLRIRAARAMSPEQKFAMGRGFLAGQVVLMAILAVACAVQWFTWLAAAAFVPVLFRGFAWFTRPPEPLAIHALGRRELLHSAVFGTVLILGFRP